MKVRLANDPGNKDKISGYLVYININININIKINIYIRMYRILNKCKKNLR